jgi:acyl-CoA dehydrogenase
MDFELNEEQKMLVTTIDKFIKKECSPEYLRDIDEKEEFPVDLFPKMCKLGFIGKAFPEAYGGMNGDIIDECLIMENLSRASAAIGLTYFLSTCFGGKSIEIYGTEEQKQQYLTKLVSGDMMFSLALTESGGGTDILGSLKTTAVKKGDKYIVNGSKLFITGARVASYLVTVARTDGGANKKSGGLSVILIDAKSPGITMRRLRKLGIRAIDTNEIFFDNVEVPVTNLMGIENKGWNHVVNTLNNERVCLAALCVGLGQAVLDRALEYAKSREAFGRAIGGFQSIQNYLSEIATDVEMARLMTYKAAWMQSKGMKCAKETAMAKYAAAEIGVQSAIKGMRIMGGHGYLLEYDMQRLYRDAELFLVAPISNEMAKVFIAMELGLPRAY